jgi:hypothetical protein
VILTVALLVVLIVPTLVWVTLRFRPKGDGKAKVTASGVRHRWWQP